PLWRGGGVSRRNLSRRRGESLSELLPSCRADRRGRTALDGPGRAGAQRGQAADGPMIRCVAVLAIGLGTPAAAAGDRQSGYEIMGPELRAMQDDEAANPGMLWVTEGAALWVAPEGAANRSCASCHGDAAQSMAGVAARYP